MSPSKKMDPFYQLQQLRDFVGTAVAESDLSGALRACGYNVELAAQELLTGEFQRRKGSGVHAISMLSSKKPKAEKPPLTAAKPKPVSLPTCTPKNHPPTVPRPSKYQNKVAPSKPPATAYLLCRRWLSDCTISSKSGSVRYEEPLLLEGSGVFFRGKCITGRLPLAVVHILRPLYEYLHITATALMAVPRVTQGQTIPVQLTVYITEPQVLLGSEAAATTKESTKQFFGKKSGAKSATTLEEATFQLLQWAEYGDVLDFAPPSPPALETENVDASLDEDEEEGERRTDAVLGHGDTVVLPEAEAPPGLANGISLRPYQQQALHFLVERETTGANRSTMEEQLELLRSMTTENNQQHNVSTAAPTGTDIHCDVGPVVVSSNVEVCTLHGQVNPINHPLWKRRYLASADMQQCFVFFVNELVHGVSCRPPPPPQPCSGGILADAMGLGKTVMVMALILQAKHVRKERGPTLVVAKLSLLSQWESEILSKTDLTCRVHYGTSSGRLDFGDVDVIITTYGTLQSEHRKNSLMMRQKWLRVVLDEAHCIRNQRTLASKACCTIEAEYRWCVSGTIIQNSLDDVYGIMKFLRHEPWCWHNFWKVAITNKANETDPVKKDAAMSCAMDRIRLVLSPIMLRRTKDSLGTNGKPILTLPPIETKVVKVDMTDDERDFYNALLDRSHRVFAGFVDRGTVAKAYFQIFSLLQRLRQACDHIALTVNSRMDDDNDVSEQANLKPYDEASLQKAGDGELGRSFLNELLQKFAAQHSSPRKQQLRSEHEDSPTRKRRASFVSNVAVSLSQAVAGKSTHAEDECPICLEKPKLEDAVLTPCAHIFCRHCLIDTLRPQHGTKSSKDLAGLCPTCQSPVDGSKIIAMKKADDDSGLTTTFLSQTMDSGSKLAVATPANRTDVPLTANQILENAVKGSDSSKLRAVFDELDLVWKDMPGSKVLIFSHYLGFLDLLQNRLRRNRVSNFRLDGSISLKDRMQVLESFRDQKGESVLVMSMSAGGEGLNIVSAATCFIVEPWWNSAKEDQCVNRIHRIGQMAKVVRVRKFVVVNSVEERIIELQKRKAHVANEIYSSSGNGDVGATSRLSLDDFRLIFKR